MSSEFANILDMFRLLRQLPQESPEFTELRDQIVQRCLPLAHHIARRFEGRGQTRDDLIQVACVGLMNAVNRFDVEAGYEFPSYAVPTIMGEVRRHFRDNGWSVRVPRRLKELHSRLNVATEDLTQRLGRAPTVSELAAELEVDRDEVLEGVMAANSYSSASIDAAAGPYEDSLSFAEVTGDLDMALERIENRLALQPLLDKLPSRERTLLRLRFFESQSQSQIAQQLGISQMHVSRLLAKTLERLRNQLQ